MQPEKALLKLLVDGGRESRVLSGEITRQHVLPGRGLREEATREGWAAATQGEVTRGCTENGAEWGIVARQSPEIT